MIFHCLYSFCFFSLFHVFCFFFFFQAEDGIRDHCVTGVQTCALPIFGKSTIVNRLIGHDVGKVGTIRESDGRGRHTTTARHLVELPSGALLIDTPGMRELVPWTQSGSVDGAFDDIATLARDCRFADCGHETEPGCAVLAAADSGRLDRDRLEHYRRLLREAAFEERKRDKAAAANAKRRWRQTQQSLKALYRDRDRS